MDNTDKFTGKAKIYKTARPSYAQAFIDYLSRDRHLGPGSVVADIGSGTGILTRQLLDLGAQVFAVEPNAEMRAIAEEDLAAWSGFISVDGSASQTSLPDKSVDMVFAAQAFHWFDPQAFKQECRRILRLDGEVFLVWNQRELSSPVNRENEAVFREYCPNFKGYSGGKAERPDDIAAFFPGGFETRRFGHPLLYDREGFLSRACSASYALTGTSPRYQDFIAALNALFSRHAKKGMLVLPNQTEAFIGRVSAL